MATKWFPTLRFPTFRKLRGAALILFLALVIVISGGQDYRPSALARTIAPFRYGLVGWEISNFADKWLYQLGRLLPWRSTADQTEKGRLAVEYFQLGRELERLELRSLLEPSNPGSPDPNSSRIADIRDQRRELQADVEAIIESQIGAVLSQEGFSSRIGLIFPPVDTVFSRAPGVLILSPRDRIHRLKAIPLRPGLTEEEKELIETEILDQQNLAALVEEIGGIATYPSVVAEPGNMRFAMVTVAHEWLHHWFFFKPLGQAFWDGPEMTTLNETAATIAGQEIGNRAYAAMTGAPVEPPLDPDQAVKSFDYDVAIRETRGRVDQFLSQGKVNEAEAYMEERRLLLAEHGFRIRKINQAFFAFRESYATGPASISPIAGQLQELRDQSESLEDFLRTVAQFGSYGEFLEHLEGL